MELMGFTTQFCSSKTHWTWTIANQICINYRLRRATTIVTNTMYYISLYVRHHRWLWPFFRSVHSIYCVFTIYSIRFDSNPLLAYNIHTHGSASNNKIIIIYIAIALLFYSVLYRSDQTAMAAAAATSGCSFRTKRERLKEKKEKSKRHNSAQQQWFKRKKESTRRQRNKAKQSEQNECMERSGSISTAAAGCMNVVHLCMHKNLIRSPLNCTKSREKCTPNGVIAQKVRKMWCNRETRAKKAKKAKTKTHTIEIILNYIRTWAHATKIKRHYCQWPEWLVGSVGFLVGAATATVVAVSAARTRERYTVIHFNCAKIYLPVVDWLCLFALRTRPNDCVNMHSEVYCCCCCCTSVRVEMERTETPITNGRDYQRSVCVW